MFVVVTAFTVIAPFSRLAPPVCATVLIETPPFGLAIVSALVFTAAASTTPGTSAVARVLVVFTPVLTVSTADADVRSDWTVSAERLDRRTAGEADHVPECHRASGTGSHNQCTSYGQSHHRSNKLLDLHHATHKLSYWPSALTCHRSNSPSLL